MFTYHNDPSIKFMSAIRPGADLTMLWPRFAYWLLAEEVANAAKKHRKTKKAVAKVASLFRRWVEGDTVARAEWRESRSAAADAAYAAADDDAAYAAYAAADYAAYAGDYAAYAGDYAADYAAAAAAKGAHGRRGDGQQIHGQDDQSTKRQADKLQ